MVDIWNDEHPDIQVTVNKQDGGDPAITKLLTAIKAGSGAPDLIQAEYQKIPTLVASDALADLAGTSAADLSGEFPDGVWDSVTLGGDALYAIPQDTGPMMFYYRDDIFTQLGLTVPTTWDEYAATARALHTADPSKYLGTFSSNDAGWFAGLSQQAEASGGRSTATPGASASTRSPRRQVADYWGGLVEEGVIDNKPMYTPEWNAALNDGTQAGWLGAVWGPGVLSGNAADTAGLWKAATLPELGLRCLQRQLGRLVDRGHLAVEERRRRGGVRHLAEHRPRGRAGPRHRDGHLPGLDGGRGIRPHRRRRSSSATSPTSTTSPPRPRRRSRRSSTART